LLGSIKINDLDPFYISLKSLVAKRGMRLSSKRKKKKKRERKRKKKKKR